MTTELLWEQQLDAEFILLSPFSSPTGDRLLVGYGDPEDFGGGGPVTRVTIHDLATGEVLLDRATTLDIVGAY